jgi:hypothetical protein
MDSERDEISIFNFIRMLMTNDFQKQVNEIKKNMNKQLNKFNGNAKKLNELKLQINI